MSNLACETCKRRKVKCDRRLPICQNCLTRNHDCTYSLTANKPGPKPGSKRRKTNHTPASPNAEQSDFREIQRPELSIESQDDREHATTRGMALSQLLHPSHEPLTENPQQEALGDHHNQQQLVYEVSASFNITTAQYHTLLSSYFVNMTAFTLFHTPTFSAKLLEIGSPLLLKALLASMFSFSARFQHPSASVPAASEFHDLSKSYIGQALRDCDDEAPSLCLLQALLLKVFYELTCAVRGRAWRSLGTCVRIAYELGLHVLDHESIALSRQDSEVSNQEESRRAWWAIWEMVSSFFFPFCLRSLSSMIILAQDVFASTILRLPSGIDWTQNSTLLPIEDEFWFQGVPIGSCLLVTDPAIAWKTLRDSGNKSGKAWFIVVNALMRSAHMLSYAQAYSITGNKDNLQNRIDVVANALYCFSHALPADLKYQGEFLNFSSSIQHDSNTHAIHTMTQLTRFMIHHQHIFESTSQRLEALRTPVSVSLLSTFSKHQHSAWNNCLAAASDLVFLVRNCSPKHVEFVNPFLANTIWLGAAMQVVSREFGPADTVSSRVADLSSGFDVLEINLQAFISTWCISRTLILKLDTLEARLRSISTSREANPERERSEPNITFAAEDSTYSGARQTVHQPSVDADIDPTLWDWDIDRLLGYGGI